MLVLFAFEFNLIDDILEKMKGKSKKVRMNVSSIGKFILQDSRVIKPLISRLKSSF